MKKSQTRYLKVCKVLQKFSHGKTRIKVARLKEYWQLRKQTIVPERAHIKAMLHKAIFPVTCNATNVALQVAKTTTRVTPDFRNLQCNKMLRCNSSCTKCRTILYFSQRSRQVAGCKAMLHEAIFPATCNAAITLHYKLRKQLPV